MNRVHWLPFISALFPRKDRAGFAVLLVLGITALCSPVFAQTPQVLGIYLQYPAKLNAEDSGQLRLLTKYMVAILESHLPDSIDDIYTINGEDIAPKPDGLQNFLQGHPEITFLLKIEFLPRFGANSDWVFRCHIYKRINIQNSSESLQRCDLSKHRFRVPFNVDQVETVVELISRLVFPSEDDLHQTVSRAEVVYATCFEVNEVIEDKKLVKALKYQVELLPLELAEKLKSKMKKKGFIFQGISPSQVRLCFTSSASPLEVKKWEYQYEVRGTIGIHSDDTNLLIVNLFVLKKDVPIGILRDENKQPLEIKADDYLHLDDYLATFIINHWERFWADDRD